MRNRDLLPGFLAGAKQRLCGQNLDGEDQLDSGLMGTLRQERLPQMICCKAGDEFETRRIEFQDLEGEVNA